MVITSITLFCLASAHGSVADLRTLCLARLGFDVVFDTIGEQSLRRWARTSHRALSDGTSGWPVLSLAMRKSPIVNALFVSSSSRFS
jgi:hypothetical protein